MDEPLPSAPAALRNREPVASILTDELPAGGLVLEVASGTGEHAEYFASRFRHLVWQPSDADPANVEWIERRKSAAALDNLRSPLKLDAASETWPVIDADAILCINMVHISPWTATQGLFRGSARLLRSKAPLILYGPYFRQDVPTAPSNIAFDRSLRSRNPDWGVRDLDAVRDEAAQHGFLFERLTEMPANNLVLVFRRT